MRTSPPGKAALGCTASMWGWPLTFFLPSRRSEIPMESSFLRCGVRLSRQQAKMQRDLHHRQAVKTGGHVIDHDTHSLGKAFETAHGPRLDDIEPSKKYKAEQKRLPRNGRRNQGDDLAGDFIDHHKLRVFPAAGPGHSSGCGNSSQNRRESKRNRHPGL